MLAQAGTPHQVLLSTSSALAQLSAANSQSVSQARAVKLFTVVGRGCRCRLGGAELPTYMGLAHSRGARTRLA